MMIDPVKLERIRRSFSLLRESIAIVKGLKGVLEAPQRKAADQTPKKAAADADPASHGAVARGSHTDTPSDH